MVNIWAILALLIPICIWLMGFLIGVIVVWYFFLTPGLRKLVGARIKHTPVLLNQDSSRIIRVLRPNVDGSRYETSKMLHEMMQHPSCRFEGVTAYTTVTNFGGAADLGVAHCAKYMLQTIGDKKLDPRRVIPISEMTNGHGEELSDEEKNRLYIVPLDADVTPETDDKGRGKKKEDCVVAAGADVPASGFVDLSWLSKFMLNNTAATSMKQYALAARYETKIGMPQAAKDFMKYMTPVLITVVVAYLIWQLFKTGTFEAIGGTAASAVPGGSRINTLTAALFGGL